MIRVALPLSVDQSDYISLPRRLRLFAKVARSECFFSRNRKLSNSVASYMDEACSVEPSRPEIKMPVSPESEQNYRSLDIL